ncbi:MAG: polymer-forming cytoskeletal protein [Acidobacteriota bacterium]
MWNKKSETDYSQPSQPDHAPQNPTHGLKDRAMIGPSILVRGDLSGEEDLLVQGRVEGKIDLKKYNVTIGETGRVKADIYARTISVEGELDGNLFGEEKIIIRRTGKVKGNLVTPRVNLEDGAKFKGSIDMDSGEDGKPQRGSGRAKSAREGRTQSEPQTKPLPEAVSKLAAGRTPSRGQ